jgi:hypothetical protein
MGNPTAVGVLVGLDVGKSEHHATWLDPSGQVLGSRTVRNEQTAIEALLDSAGEHGAVAAVVDQPGSIAALALAVCQQRQVAVAYVPGLVMRPAADLYPGEAKTDRRDG